MPMKYGVFYSYWETDWTCDYPSTIKRAAACDCDVLEVGAGHLLELGDKALAEMKETARENNILLTVNVGPPKDADISAEDPRVQKAGIQFLCDVMKNMPKIDATTFIGAMYGCWPGDLTQSHKKMEYWERSVKNMKVVEKYAEDHGINICQEILNRNESFLVNDVDEGIRYLDEVGGPNIKLLLDTYHANIEEDDIVEAFRKAASRLGHVHAGESNRKLPGMCNGIPWAKIGAVLREIAYDGCVVMEPFLRPLGAVGKDCRVYRDLSNNADQEKLDAYLKEAIKFLHRNFD